VTNHATEDAQRRKAGEQARDRFAELAARGPGGSWGTTDKALWPARLALAAGWPEDETLAELERLAAAVGRGGEARALSRRTLANARREGPAPLPRLSRDELRAGGLRSAPPRPRPKPAPTPPEPLRYPPAAEVLALTRQCVAADDDPPVSAWLRSRGLEAAALLDAGADALALPVDSPCPPWAAVGGQPWASSTYRLLLPLWDWRGRPRSIVARGLDPARLYRGPKGDGKPRKTQAPPGFQRKGLVLANAAAVAALQGAAGPLERVVVVEGEPDWLTMAQALPAIPVVGIAPGSWGLDFAARLTARRWFVATDDGTERDGFAGDKYAATVARTADRSRTTVYRCRVSQLVNRRGWPAGAKPIDPENPPDWNDALTNGVFHLAEAADALRESAAPFPWTELDR